MKVWFENDRPDRESVVDIFARPDTAKSCSPKWMGDIEARVGQTPEGELSVELAVRPAPGVTIAIVPGMESSVRRVEVR